MPGTWDLRQTRATVIVQKTLGSGTPPSWVRARQSPCSRLRRAHRARFPALGGRTARAQAEHLHSTTRSRVPGLGADPHLLGTHCVSGALLGQGPPSTHEDRKHINPGLRCVRWLHWLSKATEITCCIPRRAGQPPRGQRCQCPKITGQCAAGGQGGSRPPLPRLTRKTRGRTPSLPLDAVSCLPCPGRGDARPFLVDPVGPPVTGGALPPCPSSGHYDLTATEQRPPLLFPVLTQVHTARAPRDRAFSRVASLLTCQTEDTQGKTPILTHTWKLFSDRFFFRVFQRILGNFLR